MSGQAPRLRPYTPADEEAAIALWLRTWQRHYPDIDFNARLAWWRERWRNELVPQAQIVVAENAGGMTGFVTVDPRTLYLDQIVVAPEAWGSGTAEGLLAEARRISPQGLDLQVNQDNARAIRFYQKQGFAITGEDKNISGRLTYWMKWRPERPVPVDPYQPVQRFFIRRAYVHDGRGFFR